MKNILALFIAMVLSTFTAAAQVPCGWEAPDTSIVNTEPHYNNNFYVEHLSDSIEHIEIPHATDSDTSFLPVNGGPVETVFQVPVKFWLYRDDTTSVNDIIQPYDLDRILNIANDFYSQNNASISMYGSVCDISIINDEDIFNETNPGSSGLALNATSNYDDQKLNVHITDPLLGLAFIPRSSSGKYSFYVGTGDLSDVSGVPLIDPVTYSRDHLGTEFGYHTTFIHEAGHAFGLYHTHFSRGNLIASSPSDFNGTAQQCLQEYVSRVLCHSGGTRLVRGHL